MYPCVCMGGSKRLPFPHVCLRHAFPCERFEKAFRFGSKLDMAWPLFRHIEACSNRLRDDGDSFVHASFRIYGIIFLASSWSVNHNNHYIFIHNERRESRTLLRTMDLRLRHLFWNLNITAPLTRSTMTRFKISKFLSYFRRSSRVWYR
jgi:hypothetical protein